MRNDLTEILAPPRRQPNTDAARDPMRSRGGQASVPGRSETSRDDNARPRFALPEQSERARETARNAVGISASRDGTARVQAAQSAASPAAPMRGQVEAGAPAGSAGGVAKVEASGKSAPGIGVNALLHAAAPETDPEAVADQQGGAGAKSTGPDSEDGIDVGMVMQGAGPAQAASQHVPAPFDAEMPGADPHSVIREPVGRAADAAQDADQTVANLAGISDDVANAAHGSGDRRDDGRTGYLANPDTAGDPVADPRVMAATASLATTSRGNVSGVDAAGADAAERAARGDRGPAAGPPPASDGARGVQGNGPDVNATAAEATLTEETATADSDADAEGGDSGEAAQAEPEARSGRGAGDENRSAVAQEALRRVIAGETGLARTAMAPGNGEQVARMMQAGSEALSATTKGLAQAAAEASTTAHGQAAVASQAGTGIAQTNGSILINTPLSAVPMALGMKAMNGASRFEIRLDPAELGRIAVSLDIDDEGTVKARLVVDRVETLQLLQRDARTLERAFEQAGLKPSEDGIDLSLRDDADRHARDGNGGEEDGRSSGNGGERGADETEKGLAAAEIRALARETLLARQALRRALGGVDLSI